MKRATDELSISSFEKDVISGDAIKRLIDVRSEFLQQANLTVLNGLPFGCLCLLIAQAAIDVNSMYCGFMHAMPPRNTKLLSEAVGIASFSVGIDPDKIESTMQSIERYSSLIKHIEDLMDNNPKFEQDFKEFMVWDQNNPR